MVAAFGMASSPYSHGRGLHRTKSRGDMQTAGGAAADFGVGEVYLQGVKMGAEIAMVMGQS